MKSFLYSALVALLAGEAAAYGQDVAALLERAPVLFVVRQQYKPDHHNTETFFQTGEVNTASFVPGGASMRMPNSPWFIGGISSRPRSSSKYPE